MKIKIIIFFILFSFNLGKLFCNSNDLIIKGKIVDESTDQGLPFANIFLKSNITKGTVSDLNGDFQLLLSQDNLSDTIIISYVGYKENMLAVKDAMNNSLQIELIPFTRKIEETVIKARRVISEEFTIEKVEQMDIYLNPLSKADPLLAINGMASSTTLDESANISLRGSSPAETGVFFNEVPIYDAVRFSQLNGIGTFSIFNTSIIDKMLVFPSNPPIEYGNATSGLVSIYTSDQLPESNSNYITLSLANIGGYLTRKIKEKTALTIFANYQPSGVFINLNQESLLDLKEFNTTDCGIYFIHEINNRTNFKLFNYTNTEGFEYYLRHPSYDGSFNQQKKRNFLVSNFLKKYNNAEFSINGGLSFSNEQFQYGNTNIDIDKTDCYLSVNYLYFLDKLSMKSGISYDSRIMDMQGMFPMFDYAIAENHPTVIINSNEKNPVYEGFAYLKYKLNSFWVFGVGARKNLPFNGQDNYFTYQLNASYNINDVHSFNISGGKYNKYDIPNAEIQHKHLVSNNQASFDYKYITDRLEVTSALFYKKAFIADKQENIVGGEIFSKILITNKLETQFSYTYLNAAIIEGEIEYPSKYDLGYFIRSSLKYNFTSSLYISAIALFRHGDFYLPVINSEFDEFTHVYRPLYDNLSSMRRLPTYNKLDLSISKLFSLTDKSNIIVFVNVSNLLNSKNVHSINYNSDYTGTFKEYYSKRTIYFGGLINF